MAHVHLWQVYVLAPYAAGAVVTWAMVIRNWWRRR